MPYTRPNKVISKRIFVELLGIREESVILYLWGHLWSHHVAHLTCHILYVSRYFTTSKQEQNTAVEVCSVIIAVLTFA